MSQPAKPPSPKRALSQARHIVFMTGIDVLERLPGENPILAKPFPLAALHALIAMLLEQWGHVGG